MSTKSDVQLAATKFTAVDGFNYIKVEVTNLPKDFKYDRVDFAPTNLDKTISGTNVICSLTGKELYIKLDSLESGGECGLFTGLQVEGEQLTGERYSVVLNQPRIQHITASVVCDGTYTTEWSEPLSLAVVCED